MAPTKARRIVMSDELWEELDRAAKRVDRELDRSKVIRSFARWYVGEAGAKMPERPEPAEK
ncbi:hypothetical protein [Nocardiopsis sp. NRRL B-16309]|uniref:hypothetical protein n=1 Tax=Nocardiopsis sp. NRRL B-16309 TaxID=1519494 RepID=UPI0006AFD4DB|nr:hypothetical protein [Nocardiopsis sp. NRRL B-16309]KOX10224.1 hypothetical protein ADL05_26545 [Nocardiopsis sp. NRRL B-16309]